MICKNCGKEVKDGAKFCASCGAEMALEEQVVTENEEVATSTEQVVEESAPIQPVEASPAFVDPFTVEENKPNKRKLTKIVAIVLAVLVLLGGAAFLLWDFISASFMHLMPAEKQLAYTYDRVAYSVTDGYSKQTKQLDKNKDKNYETKVNLTASASDELISDISDSLGVDIDVNKVGLQVSTFGKDEDSQLNCSVKLDDDEILAAKVIVDSLKSVYVDVPQLSDSTLKLDVEDDLNIDVSEAPTELISDLIYEGKPSNKQLKKILPRLVEVALETVEDAERASESVSVGDISKKVSYIEVELSEEDLVNMLLAVLKEAKDNKDMKQYICSLYEVLDKHSDEIDGFDFDDADDFYEEFCDAIDDLIDELEDADADDDEDFVWRTYVDYKYNIIGMSISTDDEENEISYLCVSKGKTFAYEFVVVANDETVFEIEGDGKVEKNLLSSTATISAAIDSDKMSKLAEIEFSQVDVKKLAKDELVGKLEIKAGKYIIDSIPEDYDIDSASIVIDFDSKELSSKSDIEFKLNGKTYISLSVSAAIEETKNSVKAPSDYTTDPDSWLDYSKAEELLDSIEDAGLYIEDIIEAYNDYNYDYDDYYDYDYYY